MGIFGEKYSKEAFEDAERQKKEATDELTHSPRGYMKETRKYASYTPNSYIKREWIESAAGKRERKVNERLEKLRAAGHKEASALNKQYDHLKIQAQEALSALRDFERDELGMQDEEKEKSS